MSSVDTRNIPRDSLFMFAEIVFDGAAAPVRVKVRNLSAGGMMAEAANAVSRGDRLVVNLRNVGEVKGTVAWVQGNRFGIAFENAVDASKVRSTVGESESNAPRYLRGGAKDGGSAPVRRI